MGQAERNAWLDARGDYTFNTWYISDGMSEGVRRGGRGTHCGTKPWFLYDPIKRFVDGAFGKLAKRLLHSRKINRKIALSRVVLTRPGGRGAQNEWNAVQLGTAVTWRCDKGAVHCTLTLAVISISAFITPLIHLVERFFSCCRLYLCGFPLDFRGYPF